MSDWENDKSQYVAEVTYEDGTRIKLSLNRRALTALSRALEENRPVFTYWHEDSGVYLHVTFSKVRCIVGKRES